MHFEFRAHCTSQEDDFYSGSPRALDLCRLQYLGKYYSDLQ